MIKAIIIFITTILLLMFLVIIIAAVRVIRGTDRASHETGHKHITKIEENVSAVLKNSTTGKQRVICKRTTFEKIKNLITGRRG